jgi:hypothetical protein
MVLVSNMWDKKNSQHVIDALEKDYTVSKDWTVGLYCGITLKWYYAKKNGPFNAGLYHGFPAQISASHAQMSAICRIPLCSPGVWPMYPVCPAPICTPSSKTQDITGAQGIVITLLYNVRALYPALISPLSSLT